MTRLPAAVLAAALAGACAAPTAAPTEAPAPSALLVVAPREFLPALTDYSAHRGREMSTELVALEDALAREDGADDAERLKRYLYARWRGGALRYVLLVGDSDRVPVRFMCLDRATPAAANYAFYPSDLYYADLTNEVGELDDWNARKDGFHASYFGEVRGETNKLDGVNFDAVSYRPEIAVGRWPVGSAEEAAAVAKKTIEHERALDAPAGPPPRAVFVSIDGWVDTKALMAAWAASLGKGWRSALLATGTADPPDEASVVKALEAGADVVFHAGHGHEHGWDQSVGVKSIVKFPKSPRLPVVLSAGCSTARFTVLPPYEPYLDASFAEHKGTNAGEVFADPPPAPFVYQGGLYSRDGFGEALLRAPAGGAVAYFGCNTGSQPCGLTLLEGFVQGLTRAAGADARLGDLWRGAVDHYVEKERLFDLKPDAGWYPPSIFFQGMKFMLFGDPALRVATAAPPGPASRPARP